MKASEVIHPGILLGRRLLRLGILSSAFAEKVRVTPTELHALLTGLIGLKPSLAMRLSEVLGDPVDFWLKAQINFELAKIDLQGGAKQRSKYYDLNHEHLVEEKLKLE